MKRMISILILLMEAALCGCHSNQEADDSSRVQLPEETAVFAFAGASECSRFANDSAVYAEGDEGNIQQWSFDGILQNQFRVMRESDKMEFSALLSVENDRLVYSRTNWKTDKDEIMQVPIKENEEGQYLDVDHQKKLLEIEIGDIGYCGSNWTSAFFYINEDYIVCLRDNYSEGGMIVYDLKEEKEVEIKNLPKQKKKDVEGSWNTIYQFTDAMTSIQSQVCGSQIIFNTEPVGDERYGAPYGFSIYRLGEDYVETIDERCYTAAAYITDETRQKVYYQIETDQGIWEYDCESGEKQEMISEQELRECYEGAGLAWQEQEDDDSMFLQGDTLYIIRAKSDMENTKILSYDLQGRQGLRYEQKVTQELERWIRIAEWNEGYLPDGDMTILLGKLILYSEDGACFCIDLATAEGVQAVPGDKECVYYLMAAGIDGDILSGYYEVDEVKRSREEAAKAKRQQKRKEEAEDRRKEFYENEKRAAKLSVEKQLTQLAQRMVQQNRKWRHDGKEEWESVCYAVTDLNHNGVLELILSTGSQGSGGYTTTAVYGAGAEGRAVTLQKPCTGGDDIVEITADGDIVNHIDTAYYDAEKNIWYYVTQDYFSGGYRQKGHADSVWKVEAGEGECETICGWCDDTDHKSKQYKTTYFKYVGEESQEIKKSEYDVDKIMQERFADCVKYRMAVSWGRMKQSGILSAEQSVIYQKLRDSYHNYLCRDAAEWSIQ